MLGYVLLSGHNTQERDFVSHSFALGGTHSHYQRAERALRSMGQAPLALRAALAGYGPQCRDSNRS